MTFTELIHQLPSQAHLARACDVRGPTVTGWLHRDYVPPRYWPVLREELRAVGVRVSDSDLVRLCVDREHA